MTLPGPGEDAGPDAERDRDQADPEATGDALPAAPAGPPGGRVFSLEDRPAPGLYFVAWLLSIGGIALLFIAVLAAGTAVAPFVALGGAVALGLGLATAAGYQVIARRDRHPRAYRGPSPILLFLVALVLANVPSVFLFGTGLLDERSPGGFLVGLAIGQLAYVAVIVAFVVRTRAMSWRDMGWPVRGYRWSALGTDLGYGITIMLGATFLISIAGGLLARVLDVEGPDVLPVAGTAPERLLLVLAAAVIVPIGEEVFFRGFATTAWQRDLGARAALIRGAVFFAVVHIANVTSTSFSEGFRQALLQFVVILPLGFLLGWLYQQRGIVAAIAGHATYNGLLLLLLFVVAPLLPQV